MENTHRGDASATFLRDSIRALVRRFSLSERADTACCGLTVAQAATLEALSASGPMRQGELGRRLGITPSTLTRNLARLVEAGFVTRLEDREDGRAQQVALTPAGEAAARRVEEQERGFARAVLARLPAERAEAVVEALTDLLVAVREVTESCCPGAYDHLMAEFPSGESRGKTRKEETSNGGCGCRG